MNIIESAGLTCEILNISELKHGYDLIFVMGGDGTILKAARFYAGTDTVIFGINIPGDRDSLPGYRHHRRRLITRKRLPWGFRGPTGPWNRSRSSPSA